MIISMIAMWILTIIGITYTVPFTSYILPSSPWTVTLGMANIFFIVAFPMLSIVLFFIRLLFKRKMSSRWQAGLWGFWSANLICFFIIASFMGRHFNQGTSISQQVDMNDILGDTLTIELLEDNYSDIALNIGDKIKATENFLVCNLVYLNFEKAKEKEFELINESHSRGKNLIEANSLASTINYYPEIHNNTIKLARNFIIPKGEKARAQYVNLTLKIPEGKFIHIKPEVNRVIEHYGRLADRGVSPWRYKNEIWQMSDEGLACLDCDGHAQSTDEQYTYKDFSKLNIDGKVKVHIEKGDSYNIRVTGKEAYTKKMEMEQLGNTLNISANITKSSSPVRLSITIPSLEAIDLENTDDVKITGFLQKYMSIKNTGRNEIKAFVDVDSLNVKQNGHNELDIRGSGKFMKIDLNDRAKLDAERFSVNIAEVKTLRGSRANLSVSDTLTRSGDIHRIKYEGEPTVVDHKNNH